MRDYKFRGKRSDTGKWVYGDLITWWRGEGSRAICDVGGIRHDVIPETVGQFTGLPDKNGVEIYEGDIINGFSMEMTAYEIKYGSDASFYGESAPYFGIPGAGTQTAGLNNISDWANVIGNIHDNPELLGGKRMEG